MPTKLTDLTEITALNASDFLMVVNGGNSRKVRVDNILRQLFGTTALQMFIGATEVARFISSGFFGIGTNAPAVRTHIVDSTALTNAVSRALRIDHQTSGTPAVGIGVGMEFAVETAVGNTEIGAAIEAVASDVAAATEDFNLIFRLMVNGATASEIARLTSTGRFAVGNTAPIAALHITGSAVIDGVLYTQQPAQTSIAAAATLTIAQLLTGIIQYTGAAANLTLPTGTLIEGGLPAPFLVNGSFDFSVINTGSGAATLITAAGLTLVGSMAVAAAASGRFRVRKTADNTYTVYRIS